MLREQELLQSRPQGAAQPAKDLSESLVKKSTSLNQFPTSVNSRSGPSVRPVLNSSSSSNMMGSSNSVVGGGMFGGSALLPYMAGGVGSLGPSGGSMFGAAASSNPNTMWSQSSQASGKPSVIIFCLQINS